MPTPSRQVSVSELTTYPWTFEQGVENCARLGVDAIEVCEFKLDRVRIDKQLALIGGHGLTISSVRPGVLTLFPSRSQPQPLHVPDRMARFRRTIECFGQTASRVAFITNTGVPPDGNIQEVFNVAAHEYRALAGLAGDLGTRVALEPFKASIMNVESAIWTLEQGMRIVEAVDRPTFGICIDVWNIWQNNDILNAIRVVGDRNFIVQISDWHTSRSYQDRLIPGRGENPLPSMLRAIYESGYHGSYVVEIFSGDVPDSLWKGNLEQVITESRDGLERAWHEVSVSPRPGRQSHQLL